MYPSAEQAEMIAKHFGSCRFIYNWALDTKVKSYATEGKSPSRFELTKMITEMKSECDWLKEVNSQSLQGATINLESAFTKFFREKTGFPKFKSRKNPVQSFSVPQHYKVNFDNNTVRLPKIGWVKTKLHRKFEGVQKTARVSRSATGKYFISILVDDKKEPPVTQAFDSSTTIGIDVGIKYFATLSSGSKVDNPKHLDKSIKRLKVLQTRLSKKQKGSANRNKAKLAVAKLHEKISNRRNDFQHKLSSKLISENQAIALETLNISGMLKNHRLAQSIGDSAWHSFMTKLEYKAEWYGKTILHIGQFEPSSKICNVCGHYHSNLSLSDRDWMCSDCNTVHERDVNAAINIKNFALDNQNLIGI